MAIGIQNFPNIDTSDPTNYPAGTLLDDPFGFIGTPLEVLTLGDIFQTFYRALERAKITVNGNPDNVSNGYQYASAFGLESWQDAGTPTFTVITGGGTFTIGSALVYNKYRVHGKTLHYQLRILNATISGTVNEIAVTLPFLSNYLSGGSPFPNANFRFPATYRLNNDCIVKLANPVGFGITLSREAAAAFGTGSGQDFDISIVCELP